MSITETLIDSGPIIAYSNKADRWHLVARNFFETFKGKLITTEAMATEVMWLLAEDWRVQNEFLHDLQIELFSLVSLNLSDFAYIAKLNETFKDLRGDFADLSIVALSERLSLDNVVSLDSDFDTTISQHTNTYSTVSAKAKPREGAWLKVQWKEIMCCPKCQSARHHKWWRTDDTF